MTSTADPEAHVRADANPAPRRERVWYPLDGVRGLGALVVLLFHTYQNQIAVTLPPGERTGRTANWLFVLGEGAVMLFFVISGFLLYLPLAKRVIRGGETGSPASLLVRRFARLYPLYASVVLVVWGLTNPTLDHWQDLVLHLTFTQVYSDHYIFWTIGPAWSLAVEFHFYLLLAILMPALAAAAARLHRASARIALLLGPPLLLLAGGTGYLVEKATDPSTAFDDWSLWFGPVVMVPFFALGMTLAVAAGRGLVIRSTLVRAALLTGVVAGFSWLAEHHHEVTAPHGYLDRLWFLPLTGALLISLVMAPAGSNRWLERRPMVTLGAISYGIYLLHEPFMRLCRWAGVLPARDGQVGDVAITFAVVASLAIAGAWLSSRFIEPNGSRVAALFDARGRRREYYPHLVNESKVKVGS